MLDKDSTKSTSRYMFTLKGGEVSWWSVKRSCVAGFITKVEYIAASEVVKETIWLQKLLQNLEAIPATSEPIKLFCDNSDVVTQFEKPMNHKKQKRIEQKFHLIRYIMQRGDVEVTQIALIENLTDPFA